MQSETASLQQITASSAENLNFSWISTIEIDNRLARAIRLQVTGQNQAALIECDKVLQINPQASLAYCVRALARYELGDWQGSVEDWKRCMN